MDRRRWEIVDRVFENAVERAPADRSAFLDAACAGDLEVLILFLNVDPLFDELRSDPRFQELAKCIQAPR